MREQEWDVGHDQKSNLNSRVRMLRTGYIHAFT